MTRQRWWPAALVAIIGTSFLAATFALSLADRARDIAFWGANAFPAQTGQLVDLSARWAAVVTLWCAVVWVSTGVQARLGRRRVVPATVGVLVGGWGLLALVTSLSADAWFGWAVPWPGPFSGIEWAVVGEGPIGAGDTWTVLVRPSAAAPVLLLAALLGTAWAARRHHAGTPVAADAPSARSERTALLTLGVPALSLWAGAVLLQVADDGSTATQGVVMALERTGGPLGAMILAGLALSGGGRVAWALLAAVQLVVVVPMLGAWWDGAPDDLLVSAALGVAACVLAALTAPAARAIEGLERPGESAVNA